MANRKLHAAALLIPLAYGVVLFLLWRNRDAIGPVVEAARAWTAQQGPLGVLLFGVAYAVLVVLFVPGNVITPIAIALFGPALAIAVVSIGGTCGATLCFLLARSWMRGPVSRRFCDNARFQWLDENTEKRGSLFVALARILPVMPGNLMHYAFGLTRVPLGVYVFWSWLGSLPGLVLYATGVDAVLRVFLGEPVPWTLVAAFVGILCFKLLLVMWAAKQAGVSLRLRWRKPPAPAE